MYKIVTWAFFLLIAACSTLHGEEEQDPESAFLFSIIKVIQQDRNDLSVPSAPGFSMDCLFEPYCYGLLKDARFIIIAGQVHDTEDYEEKLHYCDFEDFQVFNGEEWKSPENIYFATCGTGLGMNHWLASGDSIIRFGPWRKSAVFESSNEVLARVSFRCEIVVGDRVSKEEFFSVPFILTLEDDYISFYRIEEFRILKGLALAGEIEYNNRYDEISRKYYGYISKDHSDE